MDTRCGFVALIGEPNAGKSTLLNRMVGAKVSIVTHKVQTTRTRIRGIAIEGASQLVFVDTPGLFRPRRRLDRAMVAAAWGERGGRRRRGAADRGAPRGDRRGAGDPRRARGAGAGAGAGGAGDQQDRPGAGREAARAVGRGERAQGLRGDLHDLGRARARGRGPAEVAGGAGPGGAVALSRGPDRRRGPAADRVGDHAGEADAQAAPGAALRADRRDRGLGGAQGRVGQDRPGDLCGARRPQGDHAGAEGRDDQGGRAGGAAGAEGASSGARCTCS